MWLRAGGIEPTFGQANKLQSFLQSRDATCGFLQQARFMQDFTAATAAFRNKVVLLNFAEDSNTGELLSRTEAVQARKLHRKSVLGGDPDDGVVMYPAFNGVDVDVLRPLCASAQKIFICMHGFVHDTNNGYCYIENKKTPITTPPDLAALMYRILAAGQRTYSICLVMCYGARSAGAYADHQGPLSAQQLASSFAYKFFRRICTRRRVRLTARTGMLNFSAQQMCSLVEDEASILAQRDLTRLMSQKTEYELEEDGEQGAALAEAYRAYKAHLSYLANQRTRAAGVNVPAQAPVPDPRTHRPGVRRSTSRRGSTPRRCTAGSSSWASSTNPTRRSTERSSTPTTTIV